MILSLLTGVVTVGNAASFLLLSPSATLTTYIACSAIYSVAAWIILWVLPAAIKFDATRVAQLRSAQLMTCLIACTLMLSLYSSWIGAFFCLIIVVETYYFVPGILLLQSRTAEYQRIEFARAIGNLVVVALCVFTFSGDANVMVFGILATTFLIGVVARHLYLARFHFAPFSIDCYHFSLVLFKDAFSSTSVRTLIFARMIEVLALTVAAKYLSIEMVISLKLGTAICVALSSNARKNLYWQIAAMGVGTFLAIFLSIQLVAIYDLFMLPKALLSLTVASVIATVPFMLLYSFLLRRSIVV